MYRKIILMLILSAICGLTGVFAQSVVMYDWGDARFEDAPEAMYDTTGAFFLKSVTRLEMVYNVDDELEGYQLVHQKIKINNNDALERFNKISFSMRSFNEIISLKARFIGKDGKATELDKSHLKTIEDEDGTYKLLAIEGAQAGGIIEYYWVRKGFRNLYGNHILQARYPKRSAEFEIISPQNLRFIAKSYNGAPEMSETVDTVAKNRTLALKAVDIPALRSERFANYDANLQRVEFTIAYNYANSRNRIFNWAQMAQFMQNNITALQPEEQKEFNTLVKKIKPSKKMTTEEKIRFIESYVKTNFQLIEDKIQGHDISTIPGIVTTKYADATGYTRLFAAIFRHFDIPFELVLACEKSKRKFDVTFDGYNFLDDYLLYFPEIKKYIDPNSMYNRLGIIDGDYIGNDALFLKPVKASGIETLMPVPGHIPINDYTQSVHRTEANVKLNTQEPSANYTLTNSFSGHTAIFLQPYVYYADNESKQRLVEDIQQVDKTSNRLIKWTIANDKPADWFVKPLVISSALSGNMLVSSAGNDLLFRIGELIGKQVEMYQEKDRKQPIESEHARSYDRLLTLEIPDGYAISNPEVLNMKVELIENGQVEAYFYSEYTLSGKLLTVKCTEGYKKAYFPVEKYTEYVAVINAAADFNKIVLILKKEK